ncbi:LAME_0F06766g1_1 [Lachancea meyersii CBS 8951]|uniref:tRNA (guanine(9)-N1)-methyltransferase n=1 Tax=Lachancea meyersii CBS 8951 TaxID=1266667 RepID=A0A1G4JTN0_9SACH|nr:LAME_0F06766g1_1 [Lachancea meyersii CBS 8951]
MSGVELVQKNGSENESDRSQQGQDIAKNYTMHPLPPVPEGMSKSQWKKAWRRKRWEESREEYSQKRREKKVRAKLSRRAKIQEYKERGEELPEELCRKPRKNADQKDSGIKIKIDCAFDDLMNDKEVISLSNQITRAYSFNKRENHFADVTVTSFNKRLKERFDRDLSDSRYNEWKNFKFSEDPQLPVENTVYLTADTDEVLERLEPGTTYIVGGIVDKNRHKLLCYNKARELGIPTKKLPLAQYINLTGREVLTSTHVIQLMLRYFNNHDWKEAFESVLPPRKLEEIKKSELDSSDVDHTGKSVTGSPDNCETNDESGSAVEAVEAKSLC